MYDAEPKLEPVPCERCGAPSQCQVWKRNVCYPCSGDWFRRAPTSGDIEAKYGNQDFATEVAVHTRFVTAWILAGRQRKVA